ncbi:MAG: malto-oligosyltrehalose trehalohydrolase [Vicinamibacterales bacterium]
MSSSSVHRRLPVGAEVVSLEQTHFRVWAPAARAIDVVLPDSASPCPMAPEQGGYWVGFAPARPGDRYGFRIDGSEKVYPDPASRFQPEGPHGLSEIVDAATFAWTDHQWAGARIEGQVLYELHVGTFTREGTYAAAARELEALHALGVTVVELMPLAEFDGRFGWGYDGVDLFAPFHHYGRPDDLRAFVDAAHRVGVAVILDVVYNHLGPSGNYLRVFSPSYFTDKHDNEWGDAINFDGDDARPVRELFIANASYWIDEFHMDGLRLDATQQMFDASSPHIVAEIAAAARASAGSRRSIVVVAENEPQDTGLVRPASEGGMGLDGVWNDDFHHSAMVAVTGRAEAYYSDTRGTSQELIAAVKYGYLFQGQYYSWQRHLRGVPGLDLDPARFVAYLQNHDQVANSVRGLRLHQLTSPARARAVTALLLLMPGTPMLFQGQEFEASAPFLYFADHEPELAAGVRAGRAEFLVQFPSARAFESVAALDDPAALETFERCKLDFDERQKHAGAYALHRDLLRVRRDTPAFRAQRRGVVDGVVLSERAFMLRYMLDGANDRLLIVNLGPDLGRASIADPLVAPPQGSEWAVVWASEDPQYGGTGTPDLWPEDRWHLPAESAIVLAPRPARARKAGVRRRTA